MEIIKKFNPLTGTYEYYNIITHEWVSHPSGSALLDSLTSIASKVTSDTEVKYAVKYAVNRLMPEKIKSSRPKPNPDIDTNMGRLDTGRLIVKELQKVEEPKQSRQVLLTPPKRLYRCGGIKRIFKKI